MRYIALLAILSSLWKIQEFCCIKAWVRLVCGFIILSTTFLFFHGLIIPLQIPARRYIKFWPNEWPSSETCTPQNHIYFLKAHKCGSSTIQNILMRWGLQHQLNFVLPVKGHYLGHPKPIGADIVDDRYYDGNSSFDILAHHSRFNAAGVSELMEKDAFRFTVLREPSSLFESLYGYCGLSKISAYKGSLRRFIDSIKISDLQKHPPKLPRAHHKVGINQMSFDLGMVEANFRDERKVQELIAMVETEFDLVLITERMDESLVLLAEALCWPLEAFASLRINSRPAANRAKLSEDDRQKLRALNSADVVLYEHFEKEFQRHVDRFGQSRMDEQVKQLRAINENMTEQCVKKEKILKMNKFVDFVVDFEARPNSSDVCRLLTMPELNFTELLREEQLKRFITKN